MSKLDKSLSDSELSLLAQVDKTPPNLLSTRYKRKRNENTETDRFEIFQEEIRTLILSMFQAQEIEIKKINSNLNDIKTTNTNIETTISFLAAQNDELKKKIELLELKRNKDKEEITILEDKFENLQRECRKSNLEIKNVPKLADESRDRLIDMIITLAKTTGYVLSSSEIKDIYRVKGKDKTSSSPPIIVETSSPIVKTELLRSCKSYNIRHSHKLCAKHLGHKTREDTPIYVSEQLTSKGARLFFLARELTKSKSFKYCWTSYGRVYVRKNDNSPVITIRNEAQIQNLLLTA